MLCVLDEWCGPGSRNDGRSGGGEGKGMESVNEIVGRNILGESPHSGLRKDQRESMLV